MKVIKSPLFWGAASGLTLSVLGYSHFVIIGSVCALVLIGLGVGVLQMFGFID